ncbi:hypothetical protein BD779DRAFT_1125152 [Infundibulicybe gibba]|nr:hypothetical protein BD779DRAFT_1125152 [Infundibulicybe gibba]
MAFLSLCINLEVLHLHNPRQFACVLSGPMPSPLCLPRLHDLLLVEKRPNFDYHFLINRLTLPALKTVGISAACNLEALCRCVVRSSPDGVPRLRSVEVEYFQGLGQPLDHLQELSLAAPHIQELRIIRPSAEVLLAMEFHPSNPLLFPNLRHLTLVEPFLKGFELIDIINSRCHPPPSSGLEPHTRLRRVEVMSVVVVGHTPMIQAVRRHGMVQPFHEEFQDVAECFTDDPNFKQMCERLKSILTVREITPDSQNYQLPSHWGKLVDPLLCFFEFSESVFTFFENYECITHCSFLGTR